MQGGAQVAGWAGGLACAALVFHSRNNLCIQTKPSICGEPTYRLRINSVGVG